MKESNMIALLRAGFSSMTEERDALAQQCRELEAQHDAAAEAAGNTASANHKLLLERDQLRVRCAELYESSNQRNAAHVATIKERDALRADVNALRQQAARYERLRRLNPRQFAELHQRNLAGERFDDMVDAL